MKPAFVDIFPSALIFCKLASGRSFSSSAAEKKTIFHPISRCKPVFRAFCMNFRNADRPPHLRPAGIQRFRYLPDDGILPAEHFSRRKAFAESDTDS